MARDLFEEAGFNSAPSEGRDLFAEAGFEVPQKRQASMGTALKKSFADVGNTADTAWSMLAGGAAGLFGQDDARDRIFKGMEERAQSRNQWANPNNEEIGFGGKVAGTLATLPMQMLASGLSPASTGKTMIDAGEDASTAMKGAGIDAAGNAVGMLLPAGIGGSVAKQMATGAGLNAAQDVATKAAIQGVAKGAEAKRQFEPTLEDAFIAGTIGAAAGGVAGRQTSQRAKANAPALDGVVLVPEWL